MNRNCQLKRFDNKYSCQNSELRLEEKSLNGGLRINQIPHQLPPCNTKESYALSLNDHPFYNGVVKTVICSSVHMYLIVVVGSSVGAKKTPEQKQRGTIPGCDVFWRIFGQVVLR